MSKHSNPNSQVFTCGAAHTGNGYFYTETPIDKLIAAAKAVFAKAIR